MSEILGAADWRGSDLKATGAWAQEIDPGHVDEIDAALNGLARKNITSCEFTKEDFPIPEFSSVILNALEELENGKGLLSIRGFPVQNYGEDQLRQIFWGIGLYLGVARPMDAKGTLIGDVRDESDRKLSELESKRGYKTSGWLNWHSDPCDVVALFCLDKSASGGASRIVSSQAIHNEIARRRPDLLAVLYQPYPFSWFGREKPGQKSWSELPIFGAVKGKFASFYSRVRFVLPSESGDAPPLTSEQMEALDLVGELANDKSFVMSIQVEPGDLQLFNNYVVYHARAPFEDSTDGSHRRHLLRLWLSTANNRELPASFGIVLKDHRAGTLRGGYATPPK